MISTFFRAFVASLARMIAFDFWRGRQAPRAPRGEVSAKLVREQIRRGFASCESRRDWLLGFRSAVFLFRGPNCDLYAAVNEVLEAVEAEEGRR